MPSRVLFAYLGRQGLHDVAANSENTIMDATSPRPERRQTARKLLDLPVAVFHNGNPMEQCTVTNIGLGGMFVRCDPATFNLKDIVEPEFWLHFGGVDRRCHIKARVVRVSNGGIGIAFHRHDGPHFRYIQKMMYAETCEQLTSDTCKSLDSDVRSQEHEPRLTKVHQPPILSCAASGK